MKKILFKLLPFGVFCALKIKVIQSDVWITFFTRSTTDLNENVRPEISASNRNSQYAANKRKRDESFWTPMAGSPIRIRMENRHANHAAVFR